MKFLTIFSLFLFLSIPVFSQEETSEVDTSWTSGDWGDTTEFDNFDFDDFIFSGTRSKPTIELQYGFAQPHYSRNIFKGNFAPQGLLDLKIGYTKNDPTVQHPKLIEHDFNYLTFKWFSPDFSSDSEWDLTTDGARTETWSFGFGGSNGYGYKLAEETHIILYNADDLAWGKVDFLDNFIDTLDQDAVDVFGNAVRFNQKFESGIKVQLFDLIAVNAGFERQIIYPRHVFWQWTLSELIHGVGTGAVSLFSKAVKNSDYPLATPIVYFILNTALDFGMYELKRENMNWPLNSAAPFMIESWKVGVSFSF